MRWQPAFRYHLIDEGAFDAGDLAGRDGLPALLFRLENASDPGQLVKLADAVLAWFDVVPEWATDRVLAADSALLEEWGPRVLDAASLEAVFA